jgi:hypothetical protein
LGKKPLFFVAVVVVAAAAVVVTVFVLQINAPIERGSV